MCCTALASGGRSGGGDSGAVVRGVKWVVGEVRQRWEEVETRVRSDGERQRADQERERNERRERVRQIRAERTERERCVYVSTVCTCMFLCLFLCL